MRVSPLRPCVVECGGVNMHRRRHKRAKLCGWNFAETRKSSQCSGCGSPQQPSIFIQPEKGTRETTTTETRVTFSPCLLNPAIRLPAQSFFFAAEPQKQPRMRFFFQTKKEKFHFAGEQSQLLLMTAETEASVTSLPSLFLRAE